jgi:DNA-binding MarR family transcriptional regulator
VSTIPGPRGVTDDGSPWLSAREQAVWRGWLALNAQLPAALNRQLQADSDLSLQDFDVLVQLTESADGRLRISQLATELNWERSRFSHHYKRMESRGLVEREECPDDARGAFVVLTPRGRAAIERAAPGHARVVQDLVFAALPEEELDVLRRFVDRVLGRLGPPA